MVRVPHCFLWFTLLVVLLSSGCSMLIARSGYDLGDLKTRDDVHREFGVPISSGEIEQTSFDEYRTRRKISEEAFASSYGMAFGMTWGWAEVVCLPFETWRQTANVAFGQYVRILYHENDTIKAVWVVSDRQNDDWSRYLDHSRLEHFECAKDD